MKLSAKHLLVGLVLLDASDARAWDYPEHREIAIYAVESLDPERRKAFDALWGEAQPTSGRLCEKGADTGQSTTPDCVDWAAFPAIAGDHSCSAADALNTVLESDWILEVADVGAQLKLDLAAIEVSPVADQEADSENPFVDTRRRLADDSVRARRINVLRTADTRLQRTDPEYATRAASNNAHFLLARPRVATDAVAYGRLALEPGSPINAMGVYGWYHLRALEKARRIAEGGLTPEQRRAYALSMLVDEAFGLHFLEDMFAAGNVAGSWGDTSQRKGTHDHYNELGFEATIWGRRGPGVVLMVPRVPPLSVVLEPPELRSDVPALLRGRRPDQRGYDRPPERDDGSAGGLVARDPVLVRLAVLPLSGAEPLASREPLPGPSLRACRAGQARDGLAAAVDIAGPSARRAYPKTQVR